MKVTRATPLIAFGIAALAVMLSFTVHAQSPDHSNVTALQTATGQYITPMALRGAVQQFLNPGLLGYPDFFAGEAVRSQLSPDGKTLAILCAGQNSLVKRDGSAVDIDASTQFIFLYDVSGMHKQEPLLSQVIQQTNSHVGLVFSPDGNTLYATGGSDDAIYTYGKSGGKWVVTHSMPIKLGHFPANATTGGGLGIGVSPNASGLGISADGKTLV